MNKAFSLLELSIVLVIIGLIAGGIVAGSSMIRAAELRAVSTEYQRYQTAIYTFRDKYLSNPGDMTNATRFWGEMGDAGTGACPATAGTGTETCNGNGDGQLANIPSSGNERFLFWQHLANAGMISGVYSGVQGSGGSAHALPGENVPESKLSGSAWHASNLSVVGSNTFATTYGNTFYFGATTATGSPLGAILTPADAWSIDKKSDDGKPGMGRVISGRISTCTTAADNTDLTAEYDLILDEIECHLFLKNIF